MTKLYAASTAPFQNAELFQAHYTALPTFRKEKIDALRHPDDRFRSLCAWLLLVRVLREQGISPENIRITCGEHGKPALLGNHPLFFNLSHSGQRVLCAVSPQEVGCDVEQLRPANLKLARRFFTPAESKALFSLPPEQQEAAFFRLWTCKESFIKAVGTGLSLPLRDFRISETEVQQALYPDRHFFLRTFGPMDGYCYACCAETPNISDITFLDLSVPLSP